MPDQLAPSPARVAPGSLYRRLRSPHSAGDHWFPREASYRRFHTLVTKAEVRAIRHKVFLFAPVANPPSKQSLKHRWMALPQATPRKRTSGPSPGDTPGDVDHKAISECDQIRLPSGIKSSRHRTLVDLRDHLSASALSISYMRPLSALPRRPKGQSEYVVPSSPFTLHQTCPGGRAAIPGLAFCY